MIFREYVNKISREESGTSQLGTNTLKGLLIITDVINIMKLTHRVCFWVFSAKKVEKVTFLGSDNINPMPESRSSKSHASTLRELLILIVISKVCEKTPKGLHFWGNISKNELIK